MTTFAEVFRAVFSMSFPADFAAVLFNFLLATMEMEVPLHRAWMYNRLHLGRKGYISEFFKRCQ